MVTKLKVLTRAELIPDGADGPKLKPKLDLKASRPCFALRFRTKGTTTTCSGEVSKVPKHLLAAPKRVTTGSGLKVFADLERSWPRWQPPTPPGLDIYMR